jgi:hypothetical protein
MASASPVRAAWPVFDASTLDIRSRPANQTSHEHAATQHLDVTPSHPSEIPFIRPGSGPVVADSRYELSTSELAPVNPALTADEAGYRQSNSGGAVVVVDDASAQVLAGSGARHPHVDDLAVMGEGPVALAALKGVHHGRAGAARLCQGPTSPPQASQGGPAHRALPRNAVRKVAKPELREPAKQ